MPQAGIGTMSPCILVTSADCYTIRDHHAGNVAVSWLVELVNVGGFLGILSYYWTTYIDIWIIIGVSSI